MQTIDDTVVSMMRDLTYSRFVFYLSVYAFSAIDHFFSVVLDQGQVGRYVIE